MHSPTHLRSLQALELALRTGSLQAAAARLALTPAAVGQRIKSLEDYLGISLLVRGRSGLRATPELARALPHLEAAFRELARVTELLDLQRGQELHVAAVPDFADLWLRQRLPGFVAAHPNLRFTVNGEGTARPRVGHIDCEITFGPGPQQSGDDRRIDLLFRDFVLPISSPEIDARVASRSERERLEGFALFHVDFYKDDPQAPKWPQWVAAEGHRRTAPERGIRFTRVAQAIDTVMDGAGFALCGIALARERLEAGSLSLPFSLAAGRWTSHAFHVRFPASSLLRPQIRHFRQWLLEQARDTEQWLKIVVGEPPAAPTSYKASKRPKPGARALKPSRRTPARKA
jgi:LysR family transcriptional regulator, glycine cleavage system transcriptional activator